MTVQITCAENKKSYFSCIHSVVCLPHPGRKISQAADERANFHRNSLGKYGQIINKKTI